MTPAVGEAFALKVKVLGPVHQIPSRCYAVTPSRRLGSQFNLAPSRGIQYLDNALPEWTGVLEVQAEGLAGRRRLHFTGKGQGVFPGDVRPIKTFGGFRWTHPGVRWIRLTDPASGATGLSNPVVVSPRKPRVRIWWGDPHSQTFFSDGVRCPEELYAFARNEAFLDFFAVSDHAEPLTDRQWDYFVAVTNDSNDPGRFATLVGFEWTNSAGGHRNVYYRGSSGPILRSSERHCDTVPKLWKALAGRRALVVPHHPANARMGVPWRQCGWNPRYERLVEIMSVWGNSECPAEKGNPYPIRTLGGEKKGQHVQDALAMGFRMGFCGGGDIHDGRPGDELHVLQKNTPHYDQLSPQGLTAVLAPRLARAVLWDTMYNRLTYATTKKRTYLSFAVNGKAMGSCVRPGKTGGAEMTVEVAASANLKEVTVVKNGRNWRRLMPEDDPRVLNASCSDNDPAPGSYYYVRAVTEDLDMAWSSPVWIDGRNR